MFIFSIMSSQLVSYIQPDTLAMKNKVINYICEITQGQSSLFKSLLALMFKNIVISWKTVIIANSLLSRTYCSSQQTIFQFLLEFILTDTIQVQRDFPEYLLDGQEEYKIKPKFLSITKGFHLTPSKTSLFHECYTLSIPFFFCVFKNSRLLHVSIISLTC